MKFRVHIISLKVSLKDRAPLAKYEIYNEDGECIYATKRHVRKVVQARHAVYLDMLKKRFNNKNFKITAAHAPMHMGKSIRIINVEG